MENHHFNWWIICQWAIFHGWKSHETAAVDFPSPAAPRTSGYSMCQVSPGFSRANLASEHPNLRTSRNCSKANVGWEWFRVLCYVFFLDYLIYYNILGGMITHRDTKNSPNTIIWASKIHRDPLSTGFPLRCRQRGSCSAGHATAVQNSWQVQEGLTRKRGI